MSLLEWLAEVMKNPAAIIPLTSLVSALTSWQLTKIIIDRKTQVSVSDSIHEPVKQVSLLSQAFIDKFEERGDELYRVIDSAQVLVGRVDRLEREVEELTTKLEAQAERHAVLREEFVDIRGHLREVRAVLSSLSTQVSQLQGPINDIASWVGRRSRLNGDPTP